MTDALTSLTLANARLTAAIGRWVLTRNPREADVREMAEAADEQTRAVAAVRREIDHPAEAR